MESYRPELNRYRHVFYKVLDLAAINSWILYKEVTGKAISRRDFILQLAEELSDPYVKSRPDRKVLQPDSRMHWSAARDVTAKLQSATV